MSNAQQRPLTIALANSGRNWIGEVGHVAMLYAQLEALGHRPWLIVRRGFALEARARERGWRHLSLTFMSHFHPRIDWRDVAAWTEWGRREKCDIVHCHRGKDHWLGLAVAKRLGVPLVRTRHVVTPVQPHLMNRLLYLHASQAVISVSDAVQAGFPKSWRERLPGGAPVILSAVDSDLFTPAKRSLELRASWDARVAPQAPGTEPLWIGLVGRLQRIKGHRYFLDAAGEAAHRFPQARFWIAGAGSPERRRSLMLRTRERLIGDKFLVFDWLDDLPAALASLDVGAIASIGSEGFSRIAFEMMASGLPLAATAVGGIPMQVRPAGGARLVPPHEPGQLAQALMHWASNAAGRQTAGRANREYVAREHQPRDWAQRMVHVYEACAKK